ncbi:MAG: M28 family metallopeptidase [Promethearchaeota archaeon]
MSETIKNFKFDERRIFEYVQKFSFPRLAGTAGEKKAVELAIQTFKNLGFKEESIIKQKFEFSDFYSTTLIKLIMVLNLTFSFFLLFFIYTLPIISFIIIGAFALILLWIIKGIQRPEKPGFFAKYYGKKLSATNVIAKVPPLKMSESNCGHVLITAHLDSKSQTIRTAWRVTLYRFWLYNGIILAIFFIILMMDVFLNLGLARDIILLGIWISTLLISLSNIILMLVDTGNESPGALDNASGMAIVFELGSYFLKNPLKHFNLWVCQFSAEELGTMGSRFFVDAYEALFLKNPSFQFNFEMVSLATRNKKANKIQYLKSYGVFPRKSIAPILEKYLKKAAREENIEIEGFHVSTGAHTDTVPFHQRKLNAIDIVTKDSAFWTHSKEDTPDKVDPKVIAEACVIVAKAIRLLDNDFEKLKIQK